MQANVVWPFDRADVIVQYYNTVLTLAHMLPSVDGSCSDDFRFTNAAIIHPPFGHHSPSLRPHTVHPDFSHHSPFSPGPHATKWQVW